MNVGEFFVIECLIESSKRAASVSPPYKCIIGTLKIKAANAADKDSNLSPNKTK